MLSFRPCRNKYIQQTSITLDVMDFFQSQKLLANILTVMGYLKLENPKTSSCWKSSARNAGYTLYAILLKAIAFSAVLFFRDPVLIPYGQHGAITFYVRIAESLYHQVCMIILLVNNIFKKRAFRKVWMLLETLQNQEYVDCYPFCRASVKIVLIVSIVYYGMHIPVVIYSCSTVNIVTVVFIVLYVTDGMGFVIYQIYVLMLIWMLENMMIKTNLRLRIAVKVGDPSILLKVLQQHNGILKCVVLVNQCFGMFMLITMFEMFFSTICHLYFSVSATWLVSGKQQIYMMALRGITWAGPLMALWWTMVTKCNSFAHVVSFNLL